MQAVTPRTRANDGATTAPPGRTDAASASDAVFFGIVNALETQTLVPGQRLVEADLAAQFQVGRNSVREALHRLAGEGIVELLRHRGAAIRLLTLNETLDVLDVAERMSGLLARTAARGLRGPAAGRALGAAVKELAQAGKLDDADAFARARRHFYRALLALSGSAELQRLFPSIQMPIVYAQHRLAGLQKLRLRDYRAIATAVLDGDEDGADEAGMAHVRNVRALLLRKVDEDTQTVQLRRA
jgi:DNA-binding GntR family transcriptional regulator